MNAGSSPLQRLVRLAVLAVFVVFAFWFLAGPNGLISIGRRKARERRILNDITEFRHKLEERRHRRDWLANPDSAAMLARKLLGDKPDSAQTPR
ncbi:hypothetical protein FJY68_05825 [candidate division WOR-3 bacterium]|uniref:Septum formation initiator family protein n=1 Tax=candidate division WOR-3 bacterium TaxID=2052148 RepID=A0A937XE43_UNCW3|nr:hypothetical protein [candidate division WOR-3 bacterium]